MWSNLAWFTKSEMRLNKWICLRLWVIRETLINTQSMWWGRFVLLIWHKDGSRDACTPPSQTLGFSCKHCVCLFLWVWKWFACVRDSPAAGQRSLGVDQWRVRPMNTPAAAQHNPPAVLTGSPLLAGNNFQIEKDAFSDSESRWIIIIRKRLIFRAFGL